MRPPDDWVESSQTFSGPDPRAVDDLRPSRGRKFLRGSRDSGRAVHDDNHGALRKNLRGASTGKLARLQLFVGPEMRVDGLPPSSVDNYVRPSRPPPLKNRDPIRGNSFGLEAVDLRCRYFVVSESSDQGDLLRAQYPGGSYRYVGSL